MTTIAGPRGSGKTTELIKLCAKENAKGVSTRILVLDQRSAAHVAQLANGLRISIPHPASLDELRGSKPDHDRTEQLLVDDADNFLREIVVRESGFSVRGMTFTVDADQGDFTLLRAAPDDSGAAWLPAFVGTTDRAADVQYVAHTQTEFDLQALKDRLLRMALRSLATAKNAQKKIDDVNGLSRMAASGDSEMIAELAQRASETWRDALLLGKNAEAQMDQALQAAESGFSLHGIDMETWMREDMPVAIHPQLEEQLFSKKRVE